MDKIQRIKRTIKYLLLLGQHKYQRNAAQSQILINAEDCIAVSQTSAETASPLTRG